MSNSEIGAKLSDVYSKRMKQRRGVRLPAEGQIEFRALPAAISVHMGPDAVCKNMQTDAAAFEGWSLALYLWLGKSITLSWDRPDRLPDQRLNLHYARFLYRVRRFRSLFSEWFSVADPAALDECVVGETNDPPLYLNNPSAPRGEVSKPNRESRVELLLTNQHHDLFCRQFGLSHADRQWPVGLFQTNPASKKSAVFTGGSSAIDIIGFSPNQVSLFELKTGDNYKIGALGELLFYASVLSDVAGKRFSFCHGSGENAQRIEQALRVKAVLLVERLHPLLEHPELFPTINMAASTLGGVVALSAEGWKLSGLGENVEEGEPKFTQFG